MAISTGADEREVDPGLDAVIAELGIEPNATMAEFEVPSDPTPSPHPSASPAASATPAPSGRAPGDDGSPHETPAPATAGQPSPDGTAVADPLAGTEPFTYTVGTESKVLDGFLRVPGEGVLVPEDKVSALEQLAVRAETLERASRDTQSHNALYERLSEWHTRKPDGTDETLSGVQGLVQSRLEHAQAAAYQAVTDSYFSDPAKLASLLVFNPEANRFEFNPDAMEHARTLLQLEQQKAETQVRGYLASRYSPPPETQAPDYTQAAPTIVRQYAGPDASSLTESDTKALGAQMERYVRPATQADVRQYPHLQVGQPVVDASFRDVVVDRVALRKDAIQKATAATQADKFNAGQDRGRQPGKVPAKPVPSPAKAAAPPSPQSTKPDWDTPLEAFLSEQGISR